VETIKHSADALLSIINDILDFSKVEAGKLDLEILDFDLSQVIEDTLKTFTVIVRDKDLSLNLEISPYVHKYLKGDSGRLRQIITNLVNNAIKFTDRGHIRIRVTPAPDRSPSNHLVMFEIEDTGLGIPQETIDRLFQAFSQADTSTSRKFGGTGLGLAICKSLVHLMDGKIGVRSEVGKGSTFWFTAALPVGQFIQSEHSTATDWSKEFKGKRILVAEDNMVNQKVALLTLAKLGLNAAAVANGNEVLVALRESHFDLILMDCHMPELDGYQATRAIRADASLAYRNIPIIAMTANALVGEYDKCIASGMNDYISKPAKTEALARKILRFLPSGATSDAAKKPLAGSAPVTSKSDRTPIYDSFDTLDETALDDILLTDGKYDLVSFKEIVDQFFSDAQTRMELMRTAIITQDFAVIVNNAHALKSASAYVGAKKYSAICLELEGYNRGQFWNSSSEVFDRLMQEYKKLKLALEKLYESRKSLAA
ncbi:MAG: response regulator, partial [Proteobacteria bacterium]